MTTPPFVTGCIGTVTGGRISSLRGLFVHDSILFVDSDLTSKCY
jgi:hypothetical protein